ncbi:hypothetical protein [Streptomyces javensis]|uniref:Uncharacterized protein n=1 Tax=Streptomyces javensis TaxID=114698 RepID=A0ABS0R5Q0_9ACTN|nr:hypothetical protein [Streptomyces javensis]MBI0312711.1 hypothetical protein [Streptomyces javensis]
MPDLRGNHDPDEAGADDRPGDARQKTGPTSARETILKALICDGYRADEAEDLLDQLETDNAQQPAPRPLFFTPGCTYVSGACTDCPEPQRHLTFECKAVAKHPSRGTMVALGFSRNGAPGSEWSSSEFGEQSWHDGWRELPATNSAG